MADGAHHGVDFGVGVERGEPVHLRGEQPAVQAGVPRTAVPQADHPAAQPAAQQQLALRLAQDVHHRDAALQRAHRQGQDPQSAKRKSNKIKNHSIYVHTKFFSI